MMTKKDQEQSSLEVTQSLEVSTETLSDLPAASVVGPDAERFRSAKAASYPSAPETPVASDTAFSNGSPASSTDISLAGPSNLGPSKPGTFETGASKDVVSELAAEVAVAPSVDGSEQEKVAENSPKPASAPLSSETLFAFALPEAIRRNLIPEATTIFKHADLEKILKEHNLPADALSRDSTPSPPPSSEQSKWVLPAFFVLLYLAGLAFIYFYFEL